MDLRTSTPTAFPTGIQPVAHIPGLAAFPELGKSGAKRSKAEITELAPEAEMVVDAGMGAMTALGVALKFNAGLALLGLLGWEVWALFR